MSSFRVYCIVDNLSGEFVAKAGYYSKWSSTTYRLYTKLQHAKTTLAALKRRNKLGKRQPLILEFEFNPWEGKAVK